VEYCGREWPWSNFKEYSGIFLEGLRKTTNDLSDDSRDLH
jgi:hypothetical protein